MVSIKLNEKDTIEVVFIDGQKKATAIIPYSKIIELIEQEAYEIITKPECNCSSCAVEGFCECDPVNEDMEFSGIYVNINDK